MKKTQTFIKRDIQGETILIDNAGHLMRGYEALEEKLRMLGAEPEKLEQ